MARAIVCLPVPLSPVIRTVEVVSAMAAINSKTSRIRSPVPISAGAALTGAGGVLTTPPGRASGRSLG